MAGLVDIPKFIDYRDQIQRHPDRDYPVLSLEGKTTIAIHHSLTKRDQSGSNADGYARYHVETHGWPSIGYSYVIDPDGTIKFCNDIELRTYHVGDHNNYAVGIVLTGDFRYEDPTPEQKQSLRNLVEALQNEYSHLKYIQGHNEFSGYERKECPEFDYRAVLNESGHNKQSESLPGEYTIQEGDTLWSIAKGLKSVSVDDLKAANPDVDPAKLKIGQKINLGNAEGSSDQLSETSDYKGNSIVDYLNHIGEDSSYSHRAELAKQYGIGGYEGAAAQNTELLNAMQSGEPKSNSGKSISEMAQEIIDGQHGNGHANRRQSLGISQSKYEKVRAEVNQRAGGGGNNGKSVNQMADEVIAGKHGSGHENRRRSLGISQSRYEKVGAEVNSRF